MTAGPMAPAGVDAHSDRLMVRRGEPGVTHRAYAPKLADSQEPGTTPEDRFATGRGSEAALETAGPSCTDGPGRQGVLRARPPQGRWPPATPAKRTRPYDLTDPALARVRARPRPELWDPDEPMTLHEAVAPMFPAGPISVWTLRTARRQGQLGTVTVAGRIYTSVEAVRAMTRPNQLGPSRDSGAARAPADQPFQVASATRPGKA